MSEEQIERLAWIFFGHLSRQCAIACVKAILANPPAAQGHYAGTKRTKLRLESF